MQLAFLGIIGLTAGVLAGLFGIGGGVIIVPALMFLSGFSQLSAHGTSLGALVLPVGLMGAFIYYRAGYVRIKTAAWLSLGLFAGTYIGASTAVSLSGSSLRILFGVFLIYAGLRLTSLWHYMILKLFGRPKRPCIQKEEKHHILAIPIGLTAGILSGLFGIGGGIIIVPALVKFMHYHQKTASGTCLGALLPPVGILGVLIYHQAGAFSINSALPIAFGIMLGAIAGAKLAINIHADHLKIGYGILVLIVGIKLISGL